MTSDPFPVLPFTALVGQAVLQRALLLLAVNPRLAGLLIRGERGTGKSTAARSLAALLPAKDGQRPAFETLPLGATCDQVVGSFDLERALKSGERHFQPGLLHRVHLGVLYVDEVNLLDDHLVDLLLDVAASGVNVVAREGLSLQHPAEFALIGTMNPEEGELRPQLTDRFGLCVELQSLTDPADRAAIVTRALDFEADPQAFTKRYALEQKKLAAAIERARMKLSDVEVAEPWITAAASLSLALDAAGHRPDILLVKAARTLAALADRDHITADDFVKAAEVVYPHRLARPAFDEEAAAPEAARARIHQAALQVAKKKDLTTP